MKIGDKEYSVATIESNCIIKEFLQNVADYYSYGDVDYYLVNNFAFILKEVE